MMTPIQELRVLENGVGQVSYGIARWTAEQYGIWNRFVQDYGLPGDWEDPENGEPLGIDVGEFIVWILEVLG
jgi:hypothetical protein